jgi:hypothetical protein
MDIRLPVPKKLIYYCCHPVINKMTEDVVVTREVPMSLDIIGSFLRFCYSEMLELDNA